MRERFADAALALGVVATVLAFAIGATLGGGDRPNPVPGLGWVLIVVGGGALALRCRHPVAVLLVSLVATAMYYPLTEPDGPMMIVFVVALYTVAAQGRLRVAVSVAAIAMTLVVYGEISSPVNNLAGIALWLVGGWFVAVVAIGGVVHNRAAYLREAERRALAAEHGREEEARRRATEERLRIAREVHDVLGHNISLINVQASAALHGGGPADKDAALDAIKRASKETLRELRTTLGVLRQVDERAPTGPAPGIAGLRELTERLAGIGLAAHVDFDGERRPVPPETDLAVYRIVQEALTNVTRHSDATSATVRVRFAARDLLVRITDNGRSAVAEKPTGSGTGIPGMRDRAEALGGTLEAGPDGTGYRVQARLPLPEALPEGS